MALRGIDISNWQRGFSIAKNRPGFVVVKATEGTGFVDRSCEGFVQEAMANGIPWGFYHFARPNNAQTEARFFHESTKGYVGKGIPVLDFEDSRCSNAWLDEFVKQYHLLSGVYPWVYTSSDFINNRGYGSDYVKANCGLWLAGYPQHYTGYPDSKCPYKHDGWTLAAWQFTDSLSMGGFKVDGDFFYGDAEAWGKYVNPEYKHDGPEGSTLQIATDVINGVYGNGEARRNALGSRYTEVQNEVTTIYRLANDVIKGKYGNGDKRKSQLGNYYSIVQQVVNTLV